MNQPPIPVSQLSRHVSQLPRPVSQPPIPVTQENQLPVSMTQEIQPPVGMFVKRESKPIIPVSQAPIGLHVSQPPLPISQPPLPVTGEIQPPVSKTHESQPHMPVYTAGEPTPFEDGTEQSTFYTSDTGEPRT